MFHRVVSGLVHHHLLDEEVAGETLLGDQFVLLAETPNVSRRPRTATSDKALLGLLPEHGVGVGDHGQLDLAVEADALGELGQLDRIGLGDLEQLVVDGVVVIRGPLLVEFFLGLHPQVRVLQLEEIFGLARVDHVLDVSQRALVLLHEHEPLVVAVLLLAVVAVLGEDERDAVLGVGAEQEGVVGLLVLEIEHHQFEVELVPEHRHVLLQHGEASIVTALEERLSDLRVGARAGEDDAFLVLVEDFVVDAGAAVVAVNPRPRSQTDEVGVARHVVGDGEQVIGLVEPLLLLFAEVPAELGGFVAVGDLGLHRIDVQFAAEEGEELVLVALGDLLWDGPHNTVVGDTEVLLIDQLHLLRVLVHAGKTVQQAEIRVPVQVLEPHDRVFDVNDHCWTPFLKIGSILR